MPVTRFGVSLEKELLLALDEYVKDNSFANRSQAIRSLIERNIAETKWMCNNHVAGAIVLVYEPQKNDIATHILSIQQSHSDLILSTQRFFRQHRCLEVIAVEGTAQQLTCLSDAFLSLKGLTHGKLVMSRL